MKKLTFRHDTHRQNKTLLLFSEMIFALLLLLISHQALALACRDNIADGGLAHVIVIPDIRLPSTAPIGSVIWRSPNQSTKAVCYKDFIQTSPEYVYMYINPMEMTFKNNLEFGININGVNYPLLEGQRTQIRLNTVINGCSSPNVTQEQCKQDTQKTFDYSYHLYIRKMGNTPSSGTYDIGSGSETIAYFQLDGEGGLNTNGNYRLYAWGLANIKFIGCQANANFSPGSVDLGRIGTAGKITGGRADKQSRQFSLTVNVNCAEDIGVDVYFDSPEIISGDGTALELPNGLNLKLREDASGQYVVFKDVNTGFLEKFERLRQKTRTYSTELYWRAQEPVIGPFDTSATVTLYYN